MWNEKIARQRLNLPVARMDALDLEAEAEGNATNYFKRHNIAPTAKGRRFQKEQNDQSRGAAVIGCRVVKAFTVDHAAAVARVTFVPQRAMKLVQI